jgi:alkylated DNA repair dioxygenase AlkB
MLAFSSVSARVPLQASLFDRGDPAVDLSRLDQLRRTDLDATAWVEYLPGFVSGQDALMDSLVRSTSWHSERRAMYDRMVDVPRLVASLPDDGPGHPLLARIGAALSVRYGVDFVRLGLGYYRNGDDSVAWHGDYVARKLPDALVATVSLGGPRRFLLRPHGGGRSVSFMLGQGDLFVMGGACQRTWQHAIPKVARAPARLALMYRPIWREPAGTPAR